MRRKRMGRVAPGKKEFDNRILFVLNLDILRVSGGGRIKFDMSKWTDIDEWKRLIGGESCPICARGKPTNIIAELDASYLTAGEQTSIRGACTLFFKRHAVELYELSPDELTAFMRDAQKASKAVHKTTGAVKMNYEIHGNTIPHLHLHLFPRYVGDQFENRPIDPRMTTPPAYAPGEFADFAAEIQKRLNETKNAPGDLSGL